MSIFDICIYVHKHDEGQRRRWCTKNGKKKNGTIKIEKFMMKRRKIQIIHLFINGKSARETKEGRIFMFVIVGVVVDVYVL